MWYLKDVKNMTELVFTVVDQDFKYIENSPLLEFMLGTNPLSQLGAFLERLLYVAPYEFRDRNSGKAFDVLMSYIMAGDEWSLLSNASNATKTTSEIMSTTPSNSRGESANNLHFLQEASALPANDLYLKEKKSSEQFESTCPSPIQKTTSSPPPSIKGIIVHQSELHGLGVEDSSAATEDYLNYVKLLGAFSNADETLKRKIVNTLMMLIPQYGACFMFNTAWNPKDTIAGRRVSSKTGEETGLSLEIYVDRINHINSPTASSVGARVTIHSPNKWPNPVEQGYLVQPNTRNIFALQNVNMSRLESPYSTDCLSDWSRTDYKPFYSMENTKASLDYSLVQCERLRETAEIAKTCHCLNPEIQDNFLDNGKSYQSYPKCNISIGGEFLNQEMQGNLGLDSFRGSPYGTSKYRRMYRIVQY
ncbi:unnamed protein product [Darwinula stevensoni]|uniref:Uncharacterized protein n=1 Tax=Darwinula stevensoni TaxID=69355 RepID=A0A7R8XAT0_9CRUS|nr:unnamed protein product [Darwinula stevensoni]CAG0890938.1 unnamed protein product [Darwinula stevensoni]